MEQAEKQLQELENLIETKSKEFGQEFAKEVEEKHSALTEKLMGDFEQQQKQLDSLSLKFDENIVAPRKKANEGILSDMFFKSLEEYRSGLRGSANGELNTKATMTAADNYTGDVVLPTQLPTIYNNPFADPARARNLVAQGTTGQTDSVSFTTGSVAGTDAPPAPTAPNSDKPENEFDFTESVFPIQTIAATARITNQMLSDKAQLQSWIQAIMLQRLLNVEDEQIINGNGTPPNLSGAITNATTVTQTNSSAATDANAQTIDALRAGLSYLALNRYNADTILMNPADFYNMIGLKDADENYLNKMLTYDGGGQVRLYGVPIIPHNTIAADTVLMGALRQAYMYMVREAISVRVFDQDRDNVLKNLQTFRIEMRAVGVPVLPTGLATFTISTLITDLQS